ncbi:hypothetical protein MTO96_000897 [Rhipicephalus appendiculatus]
MEVCEMQQSEHAVYIRAYGHLAVLICLNNARNHSAPPVVTTTISRACLAAFDGVGEDEFALALLNVRPLQSRATDFNHNELLRRVTVICFTELDLPTIGPRVPASSWNPPSRVTFYNSTGALVPCTVQGDPRPDVHWVRASTGLPVRDVPGVVTARADGTLSFAPFRAQDYRQDVHAATYRCVASNAAGSVGSRDVQVRASTWGSSYGQNPVSVMRQSSLQKRRATEILV